jgi:hypothetical protein
MDEKESLRAAPPSDKLVTLRDNALVPFACR